MEMRKSLMALLAGVSLTASGVGHGDLNSPDTEGYLSRGRLMFNQSNYEGCFDQMINVIELGATAAELEEARWLMIQSALKLDDDATMEMLQAWLTDYPMSVHRQQALKLAGDIPFAAGDYKGALEAYGKVDARALTDTERGELLYREAYSAMMLGDYDAALRDFGHLRGNSEYSNAALFYEGYIAYAQKDFNRALELLRQVDTTRDPGSTAPYYLAQIYYVRGDNNKALENARRAMATSLVPEFTTESKRIAGESLYNLGDTEGAAAYLWDYAASTNDPQPSAYYILGISEWNKGDYKSAAKLLQQATSTDDAMGQSAYLYLGQAYLKDNNLNSALMAFEKSYKMGYDPMTTETAFYNYAVARSNGANVPFGDTAAVFEDFLRKYPNSRYRPEVETHIITGYMSDGNYAGALATIDKISQPSAEVLGYKKRALFAEGVNKSSAGDYKGACELFGKSRAVAGDSELSAQAMLWQGDCYYRLGEMGAARKAYNDYLATAPAADGNRALAHYNLGYADYEMHDYAASQSNFTKALNAGGLDNRLSADARNRIGDCLYYEGKYSQAASQYRQAAELSPATADYSLYQAAMMRGNSGDTAGKIADLQAMMSRFADSPYVPDALLETGMAYSAKGDMNAATAAYDKLMKEYAQTSQGRKASLLKALDARSAGHLDQAEKAYKNVITSYPSSDEARVASEDLKDILAAADRLDDYVAFMKKVPGAPAVEMHDIDVAAFRAAERRYQQDGVTEPLLAYIGKYPGGVYEAEALYYLAEEAYKAGKTDEAVSYSLRIAENHPSATVAEDALLILARGLDAQGKEAEALNAYKRLEQSASTPSNLLAARHGIMVNALRSDDNKSVLEEADKVLAMADVPTETLTETHFMRGLALSRLGRGSEAEAEWGLIAADVKDVNGSKAAVYRAQSILERGDAKGAEAEVNKFIDAKPAQQYWLARGFIVLSDALRAQGRTFEADQYLNTLKANYPGEQADIFMMIEERLPKQE